VCFLKQIIGTTALHYTVDRLNLQLSTCMVCLYILTAGVGGGGGAKWLRGTKGAGGL
jgi:hypothetical protein